MRKVLIACTGSLVFAGCGSTLGWSVGTLRGDADADVASSAADTSFDGHAEATTDSAADSTMATAADSTDATDSGDIDSGYDIATSADSIDSTTSDTNAADSSDSDTHDVDGSESAIDAGHAPPCIAGEYLASGSCFLCPSGEFSTTTNAAGCTPWTTCALGTLIATSGTSKADRTCATCPGGTTSVKTNSAACQTPFAAPQSYATCGSSLAIAVADFNNDHQLDIVSANSGLGAGYCPAEVGVFLNTGSGAFAAETTYATPSGWLGPLAIGDFNNDTLPDVVVGEGDSPQVGVLLNTGDWSGTGGFQAQATYSVGGCGHTGGTSLGVGVGDFNGDHFDDIAVANTCTDTVAVLKNLGNGLFGTMIAYSVGTSPTAVATGDFDGDGMIDIAVANQGSVSVLINAGGGAFATQVTYAVAATTATNAIVVGDVNNDGKPDLLVSNDNGYGTINVMINNGDGTFAAATGNGVGFNPVDLATSDFNGDGLLDIVIANQDARNVSLALNLGGGQFSSQVTFVSGNQYTPTSIATGDFDGDSHPDIATSDGSHNTISVIMNQIQ